MDIPLPTIPRAAVFRGEIEFLVFPIPEPPNPVPAIGLELVYPLCIMPDYPEFIMLVLDPMKAIGAGELFELLYTPSIIFFIQVKIVIKFI